MSKDPAQEKRANILKAAQETFTHYGFRRVSMDTIAQGVGMSRSSLYHHFRNKEDVFLALIESLEDAALARAEAAASGPGDLRARLIGALEAKLGHFFELLSGTRHGPELLDESGRLAGPLIGECNARYSALLCRVLARADSDGEIDLEGSATDPREAAEFLLRCAEGLRQQSGEELTPADYRDRLALLVTTAVRGWARP